MAEKIPKLYRFVYDSLERSTYLTYGDDMVISAEGSQQGDPLSELDFCESIQPTLLEHEARTIMGFVDDIDSEGEVSHVARDVQAIIDSNASTGLTLNSH